MADELACFLRMCAFQQSGWLMSHPLLTMLAMNVMVVSSLTAFGLTALAYCTTYGSFLDMRFIAGCFTGAHAKQQLQQGDDRQVCLHLHAHLHQPRPVRVSWQDCMPLSRVCGLTTHLSVLHRASLGTCRQLSQISRAVRWLWLTYSRTANLTLSMVSLKGCRCRRRLQLKERSLAEPLWPTRR